MLQRPEGSEHAEFYAGYIKMVPDGDLFDFLQKQSDRYSKLIEGLSADQLNHSYEEGKWSIREVVSHVVDTERVFAFRVLAAIRNDENAIPGFDQNLYAAASNISHLDKEDLSDLFTAQRMSNIVFLSTIPDADWTRTCNASNYDASARAIAYMIGGHAEHHLRILKERYL